MNENVDLSNMLFSAVHFAPIQNTYFFVFSYLKYCRSTSTKCIVYSDVGGLYLSGKDSGLNLSEMTQVYLIYRERLVSFRKDSRLNLDHSNTTLRYPNTRSTPLPILHIFAPTGGWEKIIQNI